MEDIKDVSQNPAVKKLLFQAPPQPTPPAQQKLPQAQIVGIPAFGDLFIPIEEIDA